MSTNRRHKDHVDFEAAINRSYRKWFNEKSNPSARLKGNLSPDSVGLFGRIELAYEDPDIERPDFYIGSWYRGEEGAALVYSWAAKGAAAFFKETDPTKVRVRRTLVARAGEIHDIEDEWMVPQEGEAFASRSQQLRVPKAPPRRPIRNRTADPVVPSPSVEAKPTPIEPVAAPLERKPVDTSLIPRDQNVAHASPAGRALGACCAPDRAAGLSSGHSATGPVRSRRQTFAVAAGGSRTPGHG